MNLPAFKSNSFLLPIYFLSFFFFFSSTAQSSSSDIQAQLSDSSGSTGFSVQNSSGAQVARVDSYGDLTAQGNVGIGTSATGSGGVNVLLYVSPQGETPEYAVGAGDVYIQNNLEVDGTTYLNDVYINGLQVNGATFQGGPSMDTLTVAGNSFLANSSGNVGIGTSAPASKLTVNGGAAIGTGLNYLSTPAPSNGLMVEGNVGIGSLSPGEALDVNGTVRTTGLTMSGGGPMTGYVLTAGDNSGDLIWSTAGGVSGWTNSGNNVYETNGGNVGIGTSLLTTSALTVMNGNVGIGTWVPAAPLAVGANAFTVNSAGAITATTGITTTGGYAQSGVSPNTLSGTTTFSAAGTSASFTGNVGIGTSNTAGGNLIVNGGGNVGIGSLAPGEALDVNGTVRTTGLTMSGGGPMTGYVLTAGDNSGDLIWSTAGGVSGWTNSGNNVYETNGGNVGIGTSLLTTSALTVMNGNVGIGTWVPAAPLAVGANAFTVNSAGAITATTGITTTGGYAQSGVSPNTISGTTTFSAAGTSASFTGNVGIGTNNTAGGNLIVNGGGNVGIGTLAPGEALDVNGTVRTTGLTMSGGGPMTGYVLTAGDNSGDLIWSTAGGVSGWTNSGNNVYETNGGNVGIGTSLLTTSALTVMNGNVGIGTWVPAAPLAVGANAFTVNSAGAITAMSGITTTGGYAQSGNGINTLSGNVGIGSLTPGQLLDVAGTVRTTGLTMSGGGPMTGYVLTAGDNSGDLIWSTAGGVSGWTNSGNNVYETNGGNVGIGTNLLTTAALTVMNGNVGIGTWVPAAPLAVGANAFTVNSTGAITATTGITTTGGYAQSGGSPNTISGATTFSAAGTSASFTGNVGIGTSTPQGSFVVSSGNVGIGTWVPAAPLAVGANAFTVNSAGAITATTGITTTGSYAQSGGSPNTLSGTTTFSAAGTSASFTGNVGIGTSNTTGGNLIVNGGGNVGIGTLTPGQALDVNGTVRATGLTMSSGNPMSGYVLTASDSSGDTMWATAGAVSGWTNSGNDVYETNGGNVGIGTSLLTTSALTVMNGNVGIGTWVPAAPLAVGANAFTVNSAGAITATTGITTSGAYTQNGSGINAFSGNVGIGTLTPGQLLDVAGTTRTTGLTMSSGNPMSGYVLTASDSSGDTMWATAGAVSGWTNSGNDVYETNGGNVGIGTSLLTTSALTVMNGNVGIGTWVPAAPLAVGANAFTVNSAGAITATTGITTTGGYAQSGVSPNTISGTTTFSAAGTSASFTGNVGIGTSNTAGGNLIVNGGGNVGIGTLTPGEALDVNGTVRATGLTMSSGNPMSGYVLTASDSSGDTMWATAGAVSGWTNSGNDVYETNGGNVGIGTSLLTTSALTVMNGNVGIGTWVPAAPLAVGANAFTVNSAGAITATTGITTTGGYAQSGVSPNTISGTTTFSAAGTSASFTGNVGIGTSNTAGGNLIVNGGGNVGIGTLTPGEALDVNGTVRATGLTMSSGNPMSGYVLTASDSSGDTMWATAGAVSGWTNSGNNVYETNGGNVGIGTSLLTTSALTVMNGNVGIGTWVPAAPLAVGANAFTVNSAGAITATTGITTSGAYTQNGSGINAFSGNVGIATYNPSQALEVGLQRLDISSSGNIGIGTIVPNNSIIVATGNVGIGTPFPGQLLDVQGTIRAAGLTMSGGSPMSGYVLTASDSSGDVMWSTAGNVSGWTVSGNNLYETNNAGNVGIGTTLSSNGLDISTNVSVGTAYAGNETAPANSLIVQNNVGIGTWEPSSALVVGTNAFTVSSAGAITAKGGYTQSGNGINSFSGNVGIGTTTPGGGLTVINGNVGLGTWEPINTLDVNSNAAIGANYAGIKTAPPNGLIVQGNVGIGTSSAQTGLAVLGNVGIGTWTAENGRLIVMGGNVGIGTNVPPVGFSVGNGVPQHVSTANDAYFGNNLEVTGTVYANFLTGTQTYTGDLDLGGYFIKSNSGPNANGTVLIHGGLGADTTDLVVAPNSFVGIGTTTPASRLTVIGGTSIGDGLNYLTTVAPGNGLIVQGNVGFGTYNPSQALEVGLQRLDISSSGNIGIGTIVPNNSIIVATGNVGIGTPFPGQLLDVQGTIRTAGLTMSSGSPMSGYVLTASDSSGDTMWATAGAVSGWTNSGNDVYETNGGNVGIGTSLLTTSALTVMNGNVGIGTWVPSAPLAVGANAFTVNSAGAITATTGITTTGGYAQSGTSPNTLSGTTTFSAAGTSASFTGNVGIGTSNTAGGNLIVNGGGNVGIGTLTPGQALDVNGTIRATGLTMSSGSPMSGYVLTASDSSGDVMWSTAGGVSGWTNSGNNVYETNGGNVGIGTSLLTTSALTVMNGNVGIGTWIPSRALEVEASSSGTSLNSASVAAIGIHNLNTTNNNFSDLAFSTLDTSGTSKLGSKISGVFTNHTAGSVTGDMAFTTTNAGTTSEKMRLTAAGNVGIGTNTPAGALTVMNGNVGIGTWVVNSGSLIIANGVGNVGIGTITPGVALDVNGIIRSISGGFTFPDGSTQTSALGNNSWSMGSGNVYLTNGSNNVGIGTMTPQGGFVVTNGNVGIGTWSPTAALTVGVGANAFTVTSAGAISGTTGITTTGGYAQSGTSPNTLSGTTTFSAAGTSASFTGNVGIGTSNTAGGNLIVNGGGNVGIGTLTPGQALDVNGTIRATGLTMSSGSPMSGYVLTASDSSGDVMWSTAGGVSGWTNSGNNVYETNGGNVGIGTSLLTTSALTVMNGNVGIGTWIPSRALEVEASSSGTSLNSASVAAIGIHNLNTTNNNFSDLAFSTLDTSGTSKLGSKISGVFINHTAGSVTGDMAFTTTNAGTTSEKMRLTAAGNVGIGTNTPAGALTVMNGNVGIGTWVVNSGSLIIANGVGNVGIGTITPGVALDVNGTIRSTSGGFTFPDGSNMTSALGNNSWSMGSGNVYLTNGSNNVGIGTTTPQGGFVVTNGNVGIGTWSPGQTLDVIGTVRATGLTMSTGSPMSGYVLTASDSSGDTLWAPSGSVGTNYWSLTAAAGNVGISTTNTVGIGTTSAGTGAGLVVMNGNVGIGTWVPSRALEVEASSSGTSLNSASVAAIGIHNLNTTNNNFSDLAFSTLDTSGTSKLGSKISGVFTNHTSGSVTGDMAFTTTNAGATSEKMRLTAAGNVGIGTNTPAGALTVMNGNVGIGTWVVNSGSLIIANGVGNVGIGTITPGVALDVNGTIRSISGGFTFPDGSTQTTSAVGASGWTLNGSNIYTTTGNNNVGIGTTTPQGGFVVTNGNVGIGTWAPGQTLDVIGTVRATGLTMSTGSPMSGYVLTASDSSGDVMWSTAGGVSGWTNSGNDVYETNGGNVGIGTNLLTTSALTVMNGNVGIGTWIPAYGLDTETGSIRVNNGIFGAGQSGTIYLGDSSFTKTFGSGWVFSGGFTAALGNTATFGQVLLDGISSTNNPQLLINTIAETGSPANAWGLGVNAPTGATNNYAAYFNGGNVGIGTTSPQGALTVMNGNVGIGTWVPGQTLDVIGTVRTTGLTMSSGSPMSGYVLTASDSSGDTMWAPSGSVGTNYWLNTAAAGNVGISTTNTVGIGTTSAGTGAGLVVMNGNVGIGTWVPSRALEVEASSSGTSLNSASVAAIGIHNLNTTNNNFSDLAFSTLDTSGASKLGSKISGVFTNHTAGSVTGDMAFTTMNVGTTSEKMRLTAAGNVGIGTNTPAGALTVMNGNVGIGTWVVSSGSLIIANGVGNVGIGTITPGVALDVNGIIRSISGGFTFPDGSTQTSALGNNSWSMGSGNVYLTNGSNNVGIGTTTPQGGFVVTNGNVGIGTWSPGQTLDVIGTVRATGLTMSTGSPMSGYVLTASDSSGDTLWAPSGSVGTNYWSLTAAAGNVGISTTNTVGIGTTSAGTGAGLVVMNGNVGIGTWVPSRALEVEASSSGTSLNSASVAAIGIHNLNTINNNFSDLAFSTLDTSGTSKLGSKISGVFINHTAGSVTGDMAFTTTNAGATSEKMRLTAAGNVGIGTNTPAGALTVMNGNVGIGTWVVSSGSLIIANGVGNVGIGTITPGVALDVNGTIRSTSGGIQFPDNTTQTTAATSTPPGGSSSQLQYNNGGSAFGGVANSAVNSNGNIGLGTTLSANKLDIQGGVGIGTSYAGYTTAPANGLLVQGNVGIGSASPGQALDVTGTIRATGLTMSSGSPLSGYVLTASDSSGDTMWAPSGSVGTNYWLNTAAAGNVGISTTNTVGIGTTSAGTGAGLVVMNGNVGIGTWVPSRALEVEASSSGTSLNSASVAAIGIHNLNTTNNNFSDLAFSTLDTSGTSKLGSKISGVFINHTAGSVTGDMAFTTTNAGTTSEKMRLTAAGNVGIGTNTPAGALTVMNGNVGIGTWVVSSGSLIIANGVGNVGIGTITPGVALDVNGTIRSTSGGIIFPDGSTQTSAASGGGWNTGSGTVYTTTGSNNVGIGTTTPQGGLVVTNGNVGIGTWAPGGALIVQGGNVGIGTFSPSALFDVNGNSILGTAVSTTDSIASYGTDSLAGGEATHVGGDSGIISSNGNGSVALGFAEGISGTANGSIISSGQGSIALGDSPAGTLESTGSGSIAMGQASVLGTLAATASGSVAIGEDVQATSNYSFVLGTNVVNSIQHTLMVGFNSTPTLMVTGSNVGINTTLSTNSLDVASNVSIGTAYAGYQAAPPNGLLVQGNVGIGSANPGQLLDVNGTIRATGLTVNSGSPISGYVLTASDSSGDVMWSTAGGVSGWTNSGNNVYETNGGNVGIGTNLLTTSALTVMNGNVGIGTWIPSRVLEVEASSSGTSLNSASVAAIGIHNLNTINNNFSDLAFSTLDTSGTSKLGSKISGVFINHTAGSVTGDMAFTTTNAGATSEKMRLTAAGNVGIGTNTPAGALTVMNGNVGIGTWVPANSLEVAAGNIGIGTSNAIVGIRGSNTILTLRNDTTSIYLGWQSGASTTGGGLKNASLGDQALNSDSTGNGNTAVGNQALASNDVGINNTAVGYYALQGGNSSSANSNTAVGVAALGDLGFAQNNVAVGYNAGWPKQSNGTVGGSDNVWIGVNSGPIGSGDYSNSVGIGSFAVVGANNVMVLGGMGANAINVGIGTFSPVNKLSVAGSASIGSGSAYIANTATNNGLNVQSNVGIGTWLPGSLLDVEGGNVGIGSVAPSGALDVGAGSICLGHTCESSWSAVGSNYWSLYGQAGNVGISTINTVGIGTTSAGAGAGLLIMNGNVGIGTWVPASSLSVQGGMGIGSATYASTAAPSNGMIVSGNVGLGTTTPQTGFVSMGNVGIGTWTAAGGNLIINGGGNVGIGSAWPGATLDVNGTLRLSGNLNNTTLNATGGNVGIGSANPGMLLDVAGGIRSTSIAASNLVYTNTNQQLAAVTLGGSLTLTSGTLADNPSGLNYWSLTAAAGNVGISTTNTVGIGTTSAGAGAGLVVMNGNVGIGTWAPQAALDMGPSGGIRLGGTTMTSWPSAGSNYWLNNGGSNVGINTTQAVGIGTSFVGGSGEATLSVMNGNVGIGTWVPAAKLQVNGEPGITPALTSSDLAVFQNDAGTSDNANLDIVSGQYAYSTLNFDNSSGSSEGYISYSAEYNQLRFGTGGGFQAELSPTSFAVDNGIAIGSTYWDANNPPTNGLTVQGNVGIGTWIGTAGLSVMNGNVGIGTWVPGQLLDITGTARMTGLTMSGGTPASGYVLTSSDSSGDTVWATSASVGTNYWLNTATAGNVGISTTNTVGIGTTSGIGAGLVVMNGNVGIGTWVPAANLEVGPFSSVTQGNILVSSSVGLTGSPIIGSSVEHSEGLSESSPYSAFIAGNDTVAGLHVAVASNSAASDNFYSVLGLRLADNNSLTGNPAAVSTGMYVPGIGFAAQSNTNQGTGMDLSASILAIVDGAVSSGVVPMSIVFNTSTTKDSGLTERMRVTSNGNVGIGTTTPLGGLVVMNGNVGIGTWVPGQLLDINGTARMTGLTMSTGSPMSGYVLTASDSSGDTVWEPSGSVGSNYWLNTAAAGNVGISTTNTVGIGTTSAGAGAGLVVMNGNVGIGTWAPGGGLVVMNGNVGIGSDPQAKLTVKDSGSGLVQIGQLSDASAYGAISFGTSISTGNFALSGSSAGNTILNAYSGNNIIFDAANVEKMRMDSNGNLGVGTTTPVGGLIVMNGNVGIGTWVPAGSLIVQGGNVGIGTNIPNAALNLSGTLAWQPSGVTNITASGGITVTRAVMRIQGSGGAVVLTANPQIAAGVDGQMVTLLGNSASNTVKLIDGNGLKLASGVSFTMGLDSMIVFVYDATNTIWTEISRAVNQ